MKRFLVILTIVFTVTGIAYLYTTDSRFKDLLRGTLDLDAQIPEDSVSNPSHPVKDSKKATERKKKIPKTVKPGPFHALDEYARKTPKKYTTDPETLSQYLLKPAKTDLQKVRTLFTWIATHVQYDAEAYNSNNYPDQSALNVLASRKAVCAGYSALMQTLCEAAGLEAKSIVGYAKGYGYKPGDKFTETDHAWNAVKIDDAWHLFDVTWGSGFGTTKDGKLVTAMEFDPFWFDVHPKAFIFTHLPEDPSWQLTGDVWQLDEYERQPYLPGAFFTVGFDPNEIYREVKSGGPREFVDVYSMDFPVKVIRIPYAKNQIAGQELSFKIQSDYAEDIVLIDGSNWHHFKKQDNTFTLLHKPVSNELQISIKINWFDEDYSTIAIYSVQNGAIVSNNF